MSSQQPNHTTTYIRFSDWCLNFDSLSEEAKHTVGMLSKRLGTSDCYEAEQRLSNLTSLTLANDLISDLTPLQSLTNLTSLSLENNQISDITLLQSLTNLTFLILANNQISDITPLQSLTNLDSLNLANNPISDLTPLQSLTNLIELDLENNPISDLTTLQFLTSLKSLGVKSNQISDLTPLQSLTNLTSLSLKNNQISDLAPLQSLTDLKLLVLCNNQISDLTPLQSLSHLTTLYLENNQISDLTPLQSLTNLIFLYLENNQISDLTPLQSLRNLAYLHLENNQISDFTPLQSLTNLTLLYLNNNQISDFTPLQSLTNFRTYALATTNKALHWRSLPFGLIIRAARNYIKSCFLRKFYNLKLLNLENNQISDLTPLQSLTNLADLYLRNNQISDLKPLQSLTNLTSLNLENNQISDLKPLQSLTNLTSLNLENNQISDLKPLQSLTNLTSLNLENNQISDLKPLQSLTNLISLALYGNPILNLTTLQSRWTAIPNSTERVDRNRAAAAIESAYAAIGKTCPKIIFCSSPHSAITQLENLKYPTNQSEFFSLFSQQITSPYRPFNLTINWQIRWELQLANELDRDFPVASEDWNYATSLFTECHMLDKIWMADFCVSVIKIVLNSEAQKAFECLKQLLVECGWIFALDDVCYACDRPLKLSLDSEDRLHAEGESAIEFADGYKLYSYHGVTLPEKYGQLHPHQWEARWILEEENAELRRVLIQGIGYARICSELQAIELDTWQEYTLLRIDSDIDGFAPEEKEPIYLLKMTCPSTGFIHALRVPPDMQSAREAIRWVNWDVDYEEFSVQT